MSKVNMVQTPIVLHNLHGPDKVVAHRHGTMTAFLNAVDGGIGGFNEFNSKDAAWFKTEVAKRKLRVYRYGQDGVVWDPAVFSQNGKPRVKKIMTGGHVGADGVHTSNPHDDDRRVGPNRFGIYVPLVVIAIDLEWEFDVTHPMARAFTVHTWRLKLFKKSIVALADGVVEDNGAMVGDMNDPHAVNLPGVNDVSVPAPATMGKQHYDQMLRWGQHIFISGVKGVNTPSDHNMLKGQITFYRTAQAKLGPAPVKPGTPAPSKPASKLPKPGQAGVNWKKYGAPVAKPWADRSARFRKRRKALWNRIVKWRAAYKRRL